MKIVRLKDETIIFLKPLTIGDVGNLCRMLFSLSDKTRKFYHDFVIVDFRTFLKKYFRILLILLLNSVEYKRHGKYFLGIIALNSQKEVVGFAYLRIKSYGFFSSATYGIVVQDAYQSKGLGDALTSYVIECGKKFKLNQITLTVLASNEKAIQLYKKYGFVVEGLHKRADVWRGNIFDVYYMALHLNQKGEK